jgi:hypothetical protein
VQPLDKFGRGVRFEPLTFGLTQKSSGAEWSSGNPSEGPIFRLLKICRNPSRSR